MCGEGIGATKQRRGGGANYFSDLIKEKREKGECVN